jgi:hypothetical protein
VKEMVNPSVMRLSKSKVGAWDWCQYSWALQNILNIRGSMHSATTTGIDAHTLVEHYYEGMMKCETDDEIITYIEDYNPGFIPNDNEEALDHLNAVIELDLARMGSLQEGGHSLVTYGKPIGIESYIRLDDDGTTQHSEFSGMIDLAFRELDGGVGIYDLKTGKFKGIENHRFELMIYKWMWEQSHPGDTVTAVGIIWSKVGKVEIEEPTTRSYNAALVKVQRTRDRISEAHKNSTPENPLAGFKKALRNPVPCSWCAPEHKKICWKEEYDIDIT